MRECTKIFCKKQNHKAENLLVFPNSMPLQGCSVSSVSNDGNCPAVMKISTWENYENSCRMQSTLLRAQRMAHWHKGDLYYEDSCPRVLLLSFTAKFSHRRNWNKKKKRQKKLFWYPKHESSPQSLHSDVTENCKQMRRVWCLNQHTDSTLQVPSLVLGFVLRSLTLKNIRETLRVGKFWPEDIFPTLQVIFSCLCRYQKPMGHSCQGSYFMLWVTFQFLLPDFWNSKFLFWANPMWRACFSRQMDILSLLI